MTNIITTDTDKAALEQIQNIYAQTDNSIIVVDLNGRYADAVSLMDGAIVLPESVDVFTNHNRYNRDWMYYIFCLISYVSKAVINRPLSANELDLLEGTIIRSMIKDPSGAHVLTDIKKEISDIADCVELKLLCNQDWFSGKYAAISFNQLCEKRLICLDMSHIADKYKQTIAAFSIAFCQRLKDEYPLVPKEMNIFFNSSLSELNESMPYLLDQLIENEENGNI